MGLADKKQLMKNGKNNCRRREKIIDANQPLEDSSGLAEISFFPDQIDLYRKVCSMPGPVWIRGKVTEHLSSITIEGHNCGAAA